MSKEVKPITNIIFTIILLWVGLTSTIYWLNNPSDSEMEVFLHIPKSFILDIK